MLFWHQSKSNSECLNDSLVFAICYFQSVKMMFTKLQLDKEMEGGTFIDKNVLESLNRALLIMTSYFFRRSIFGSRFFKGKSIYFTTLIASIHPLKQCICFCHRAVIHSLVTVFILTELAVIDYEFFFQQQYVYFQNTLVPDMRSLIKSILIIHEHQHESTRINTGQHKSNTSQHESTQIYMSLTRVQYESTRVRHKST